MKRRDVLKLVAAAPVAAIVAPAVAEPDVMTATEIRRLQAKYEADLLEVLRYPYIYAGGLTYVDLSTEFAA